MNRSPQELRSPEGGWSIFETMIAIGIIATGLMVMVQQLSISFRESNANENRAFAYQKAAALLGEIHNSIALGRITTSDDLYTLVDADRNPVLTTRVDGEGLAFEPQHPMSGNVRRRGDWMWGRTVTATPHESPGLYYCRVVIERRDDSGSWRLEASHAQLFSLLPSTDSPEQVHDVYVLACAETPSLWADLGELRAHVTSAANAIAGQSQARLRLHWIHRLGYGRDASYIPYVNTVRPADQFTPAAYWLPGALGGAHTGQQLYRSDLLAGTHRTELGLVHGNAESIPSAIADRNNHCMRTPAAWRLWEQRLAEGLEDEQELPLQLLLDDMHQRPDRYRNAIFVNLHGRGVPAPPLRNYSDAAKDPVGRPGVRVVTHPARLWTPRDPNGDTAHDDTSPLQLRVYAWRTEGAGAVLGEPILVQIHGVDLTGAINAPTGATLRIRRLPGGVNTTTGLASGTGRDYQGFDSAAGEAPAAATAPYEMWYEAGYTGGAQPYTWIKLHNTPLVAPPVGTGGLASAARLYGLEYVPSPVDGAFGRDLATASAGSNPRNTARWRIELPSEVFTGSLLPDTDQLVRVVTRIGTDYGTGQRWPTAHQPMNASETWAWWSRTPAAVPWTERSQFLGDPRLCPYADLMSGGTGFPNGYNWHFDDLADSVADARPQWPGFAPARLQDGFAGGAREDAPRLLQLLRAALQDCGSVFVAPTGPLAHTLLLGGEIAARDGNSTAGVELHQGWSGGTLPAVDTIRASGTSGAVVLRDAGADWWAKPWLGELCPEDRAAEWIATGNVALAGTDLRWELLSGAPLTGLPVGTEFAATIGAVMGDAGGMTLVNTGSSSKTYMTVAAAAAAQIAGAGVDDANEATNLVPPTGLASRSRIGLEETYGGTLPAFDFVDSYPRSTATQLERCWERVGTTDATSLIARWAGSTAAFLLPWEAPTAAANAREVARQALALGLRGLHVAGKPAVVGRAEMLPQLTILEPAAGSNHMDPLSLTVRWHTAWKRFDDRAYTTGHPASFAENESDLVYRVMYSGDNGSTWTSALSDQPTAPGSWPEDIAERLTDAGVGNESFTFPLPTLPAGEYVVLVEAWRTTTRCHNSSHKIRIYVRRSS
ncbi:MAG: hypothetical protein AB7O97_07350 [Planctomycetota bacterium]